MAVSWRILLDIMKFVPYSVLLAIPLAEVLIPVLVWIFPNAIPSFFLFDTAEDKRIENLEIMQEESHRILIEKLLEVLRQLSKRE
jgi:LETM1 and EF-hand domain-containing protein 1